MPRPSDAHIRLQALQGDWIGTEIHHPSPWSPAPHQSIGRFRMRMIVDGFFLANDYEEERDGAVVFRGHGLYGWDARRGCYTMYWVDSMGSVPADTTGGFEGDRLVFTNRSDHGHGRYTYTLRGPDALAFALESSRDGEQWTLLINGEYQRAG